MKARWLLIAVCVVHAAPLHADLVTLRSNVSWYGTILSLGAEKLILRAQFPNHVQKDLTFDRAKIASLEFNSQKLNEGDPSTALGSHEGTPAPVQSQPKDKIVFREGGQEKPCLATAIDEKEVKCGDAAYDRAEGSIWRIYFANR